MEPNHAMDDLRVIRQVMERTHRAAGGHGGWFMVLWGTIWLLGFLGTHFIPQFLPPQAINWMWAALNLIGVAGSIWLGTRPHRQGGVRYSIWTAILLWWIALAVFDLLLIWLFGLRDSDVGLLILLTIALGYFQFGLFTHWFISVVGIFIAVISVGSALLIPDYFGLTMAFLGGGALIVTGLWFVRQGK